MSGKGFGKSNGQPTEDPQATEQEIQAWCPRCASAQTVVIFQSMIQLALGNQALTVSTQCGTCHLLLWPMGLFPVQQQAMVRRGGVIAVPGGRVQ